MNLTISHYCESKVLNQKISTKHDMIYSYNAVYQIPRPRDTGLLSLISLGFKS